MLKARNTIKKHAMLRAGDRVGVALSGGADSVALLHMLANLAPEYALELFALHLNHGIRGEESDRDEAFVRKLAGSMNIPLESERISIPKLRQERGGSLEDLCRDERYAFFERMARRRRLDKVALGHTLSDQAETIIMRFLRGSGLEGLKGFLPVRDGIYIRPLMEVTRDEILSFLGEEGIPFVTDSSNRDETYLRNRIRGRLVPELKASYNVRLEENIGRTAEILRLEDDFIRESVAGIIAEWTIDTDRARLPVPKLKELHPALLWRLIKTILETHSPVKNGIGYLHVKAVADLIVAVDSYHHFNYPKPMLAGLRAALKDGGRLAIMDYYKSGFRDPDHIRAEKPEVIKEIEAEGFRLVKEIEHVPDTQYLLIFEMAD